MNITEYLKLINKSMEKIDTAELENAVNELKKAVEESRRIFTAGNGGSAATANHFAADFGKNVVKGNSPRPKIMSLCSNMSSVTAYANDEGYENAFSRQLNNWMQPGDILILISASGNSPSVVSAAELAKRNGLTVISMTGFNGGRLKELSDIKLHIETDSYEAAEDIHSIFCHSIISALKDFNL